MRAGTWRYDANKTGQVFSPRERFVSGLRNGEGFAFDDAGRLFATQHGRDQLFQNWPRFYTAAQSADLPAEELVKLVPGADYGWPECYYDQEQNKLVLAPEYGGDGKAIGVCAHRQAPVAAFPGHWAPNDLAIYHRTALPAGYRGGAFIAFHGSWNRAPLPQGGYNVVFQPLADGKASGPFVVFADGFAGAYKDPGRAAFRPTGLAEGPDGALYVSDDVHGRIWRITYNGDGSDKVAAAPAPAVVAIEPGLGTPPEGTHPDAGRSNPALPTPPGATADQVALGNRIFHGEASDGTSADVMGRTPAEVRSDLRSIQAIGCGATAASRGSPRRSRTAWRSRSNIRASCRRWAGGPFAAGRRGGGGLCLGRRPCREGMRPPMMARLLFSPQINSFEMAKILCVLYDDPIDGYPKSYPRDDLPKIDHYPGGQTLPTPKAIDFRPGTLLGSVTGGLGLKEISRSRSATLSSSPPTRRGRIRASSASFRTPKSSSRSLSGPPI